MIKYFILILCIISLSAGQVLFKVSANQLKTFTSFWQLLFYPSFMLAIFLYAATTLAWIWVLQYFPLSKAYVFMSLAFIIVPLSGWFFFNEVLSFKYIIGAIFIITGIIMASL